MTIRAHHVWAILGLLGGLAILLFLGNVTDTDLGAAVRTLGAAEPGWLILLLLVTLLHLQFGAAKWRLVTETGEEVGGMGGRYLFFTALGDLMNLFLPAGLAHLTTRSAAMKLHAREPVHRTAGLTLYDQMFDLAIPMSVLPGAILLLSGHLAPVAALAVMGVGLGTGALVLLRFADSVLLAAVAVTRHVPILRRRLTAVDAGGSRPRALPLGLAARLYLLSLLRYASIPARYWFGAMAMGFSIGIVPITAAIPVVVLTFLISPIPGALGLAEVGWVGTLVAQGIAANTATEYAVAMRILVYAAIAACCVIAFVIARLRPGVTTSSDDA